MKLVLIFGEQRLEEVLCETWISPSTLILKVDGDSV